MASNGRTYTRTCQDCGKVMQQVYQTKMRCPECDDFRVYHVEELGKCKKTL